MTRLAVLCCAASAASAASPASAAADSQPAARARAAPLPHIFLVLIDDYGYNNIGYHARSQANADEVRTPRMDALAAAGVRLERHYAFRFCSPSRSSFNTGRNPIHVNVGNDALTLFNASDPVSGAAGIPRNMTTVAEKLKAAGYATVQAGKWCAAAGWLARVVMVAAASRALRMAMARRRRRPRRHSLAPPRPRSPVFPRHCGLATFDHTPEGRGYTDTLSYLDGANECVRAL